MSKRQLKCYAKGRSWVKGHSRKRGSKTFDVKPFCRKPRRRRAAAERAAVQAVLG